MGKPSTRRCVPGVLKKPRQGNHVFKRATIGSTILAVLSRFQEILVDKGIRSSWMRMMMMMMMMTMMIPSILDT